MTCFFGILVGALLLLLLMMVAFELFSSISKYRIIQKGSTYYIELRNRFGIWRPYKENGQVLYFVETTAADLAVAKLARARTQKRVVSLYTSHGTYKRIQRSK